MSLLQYPHNITNPHRLTAEELNDNFGAIKDLVDDSLGGDNMDPDADLEVATLTIDALYADQWDIHEMTVVTLPSNDGSHALDFVDHNGTVVMRIASDGTVTTGTP